MPEHKLENFMLEINYVREDFETLLRNYAMAIQTIRTMCRAAYPVREENPTANLMFLLGMQRLFCLRETDPDYDWHWIKHLKQSSANIGAVKEAENG